MTRATKLISIAPMFLAALGCAQLTPAESCAAICSEMAECQIVIRDSSLAPGPSCQADCESRLEQRGSGCKSSASYLADGLNCSDNASSFASDCS